jgi:protein TonB
VSLRNATAPALAPDVAAALLDVPDLVAEPVAIRPAIANAERFWRAAAAGLALALHAGALAAFSIDPWPATPSGAAGRRLAAIDVTLVDSTALEARERLVATPPPAAPAKGEIAPLEGNPVEVPANASPQAEKPDEKSDQQRAASVPAQAPTLELSERAPLPKLAEVPPPPAQEVPAPGGVVARADDGLKALPAPAAASPGEISRYAHEVRAALARNKPKGRRLRGTATIMFVISQSGKVAAARVSRTSGNEQLDRIVLKTVESASFPRPPAGMSESQLTYVIPFRFE